MSKLCIKYKRVILVIGRKDTCGVSLSLHIAMNGSILQFFHNLLDCKRLCLSRPRPMLTQFNHIVSELQMLLNHDPINVNCVSFVALHQNRRTVWAFWDQNLRAVHPLPFFATPDSHHHVCLAIFNDRGEEAESYRDRSKSTSIVLGFQIIYNWATILWIAKKEILNCDRILRFRKWPFRRLWASGWVVEAPRAWVGACPRLQTKNLTVGR